MKHLITLLIAVTIVVVATSCESRSGKLVEKRQAMQLVHPDALTNHIVIKKEVTYGDVGYVTTYNYVDSTYTDYRIPMVYVNQLFLLDTIHTVTFK